MRCLGLVQRKDIGLGTPFLREIDKELAKSKVGMVLVTRALLRRLQGESIADKELSVLLTREQLVPVVHRTTYETLHEISSLIASRNGLNTRENTMAVVARPNGRVGRSLALSPGWPAAMKSNRCWNSPAWDHVRSRI